MQWRNQQGGYLREILTARVYDVAVCIRAAQDLTIMYSTYQHYDPCQNLLQISHQVVAKSS